MNLENCKDIIESSETYSEMLRKMGLRITGSNYGKLKKFISDNKLVTKKLLTMSEYTKKYNFGKIYSLEEVLVENSNYSRTNLKAKLYKCGLKKRNCEMCNQSELWFGKKISLILDHINGVHDDNRIENLRILCPNCNATLDTHCGKNNRNKTKKSPVLDKNRHLRKVNRPEYEILVDEINEMGYVGVGKKYGVSDNAVRKWVKTYLKCN